MILQYVVSIIRRLYKSFASLRFFQCFSSLPDTVDATGVYSVDATPGPEPSCLDAL